MSRTVLAALIAAVAATACQSGPAAQPAVIAKDDARSLAALKAALAAELGRASVDLGPSDPTKRATVTVLPPPPGQYETHSPAKPTVFVLSLSAGECRVTNVETGERFSLEGVSCRPLKE